MIVGVFITWTTSKEQSTKSTWCTRCSTTCAMSNRVCIRSEKSLGGPCAPNSTSFRTTKTIRFETRVYTTKNNLTTISSGWTNHRKTDRDHHNHHTQDVRNRPAKRFFRVGFLGFRTGASFAFAFRNGRQRATHGRWILVHARGVYQRIHEFVFYNPSYFYCPF
jgi:hypothetical protein